MRAAVALFLILALSLTGCLRLGESDDLHLVCEEKSGSPRKAYDVGFLVAQTRVDGELDDMDKVAILEAARAHVITMGGRPHVGFVANLTPAEGDAWRFRAIGENEGATGDHYDVLVAYATDTSAWAAAPPIRPPASVLAPAIPAAEAYHWTALAASNATWDAALPSCVTFQDGSARIVVNVVQGRVVLLESG